METKISVTSWMKNKSSWLVVPAFVLGLVGCGGSKDKMVGASIDTRLMQKASSLASGPAPTQINPGTIVMVNGTYGPGCRSQPSGTWSVAANGYSGSLDHPALQVVQGDGACTLAITDVQMQFLSTDIWQYRAQTPMALTGTYLNNAVAFEDPNNAGPIIFYANVIQDAGSGFTSAIHALFAYSSDIANVPGTFQTTFAYVNATVTTQQVPAPNYTFNLAGSTLQVQVDASNIIQTVSGNMLFSDGSVLGDDYVVVSSLSSITNYGIVHAAFQGAGVPVSISAGLSVPGSSLLFTLGVTDVTLPAHRYIIIRHKDPAEASSGVPVSSYQVFDFSFVSPP